MLKLYLKKLLFTFVFITLYILVFLTVIEFVWMHLASALQSFLGFTMHANIHYCLIILIALILELLGVYFLRIDNMKYKEQYKDNLQDTFQKDFLNTLKSSENLLHTCAYLTITIPFIFLVGYANNYPTITLIIGTVIAIIVESISFAAINTLHWCIVHKGWSKPEKTASNRKLWHTIINRLRGM